MKDKTIIEINSRKEVLGTFEVDTPNELLLVENTDAILNNRILNEFVNSIFYTTAIDISHNFDKKIKNIFISFVNDGNELICSIELDRLRFKRYKYRSSVIDWQKTGSVFKYVESQD